MPDTVLNHNGGNPYQVFSRGNFNDLGGGQQQCVGYADAWKALTGIRPDTAATVDQIHDVLAFLVREMEGQRAWGHQACSTVFFPGLPPEDISGISLQLKVGEDENIEWRPHYSSGLGSIPTTHAAWNRILPLDKWRNSAGAGNLNVKVHIPSDDLEFFQSSTAEGAKSNLDEAFEEEGCLAYSGAFPGSNDARQTDGNADWGADWYGSEYVRHLVFFLIKAYYPGLKTSVGAGRVTNYQANPFGITVWPGPTTNHQDIITWADRFYESESGFDLDRWVADQLFTGTAAQRMAKLNEYVQNLGGSGGATSLTALPNVAPNFLSVPLLVPISVYW